MRSFLLIVTMVLALAGFTGCNPGNGIPDGMHVMTGKAGAVPLANARIQMREVAQPGTPNVTTLKDRDGHPVSLLEPAFITTADIASVAIGSDDHGGRATLVMHFTDDASPRILAATRARVARQVAFTIGDKVLNVATIAGPFAGSMQVTSLDATTETHRLYTEITGKVP